MKLRIHHDTTYHYRRPVVLQPHRLLLVPRSSHELRVLHSQLTVSPEAVVEGAQDVFGNLVATARFEGLAETLVIASEVLVEQNAPAYPVFRIAPEAHTYPFGYYEGDTADLAGLLAPEYPDPEGDLAGWAHAFVAGPSTDTLSLLQGINASIGAAITYRVRDEEGTQTPLRTLALASGSCRDLSALFIDAVRHLGFGARAVSGYLYDPEAAGDDAGSTHAWADVYLPDAGWIAFDPTHRRMGSANLIPIAVGRCNERVMPVAGGYAGAAEDFVTMDVRVSVTPI